MLDAAVESFNDCRFAERFFNRRVAALPVEDLAQPVIDAPLARVAIRVAALPWLPRFEIFNVVTSFFFSHCKSSLHSVRFRHALVSAAAAPRRATPVQIPARNLHGAARRAHDPASPGDRTQAAHTRCGRRSRFCSMRTFLDGHSRGCGRIRRGGDTRSACSFASALDS